MSYLNYDGLAYFKSKLTNWVDQNYLSKTNTGNLTVAGHVTFTNPITGDLDGKAKKDWLGQKIDETYIKSIATNDNAGTIVYTKGNGSTNHILIDLLQGATPIANGRAGLVPAPTVSEMNYFLRGDGNWAIPTDVYVNQSLLTGETEAQNKDFPILLSGTSGTPTSKTNATVAYPYVVSVNPRTNALTASQFISKHPSYARTATVTSEVQYTLNFKDNVGNNLGEIVGYIDTPANGGEHQLGFRLFGNPNVQGTEEIYTNMGVGVTGGNVSYGYAPETPVYEDDGVTKRIPDPEHNHYGEDIITRSWLHLNGSVTGLVHTSMNETIDGTKTFVKKIVANDGMNATGNIATDTLTVRQDANVKGSLDVDTNLNVDGTSNLHGKVTAGNGLEVTGNTKTTTLTVTSGATVGTTLGVSGKATISGGLAVTSGTTTDTLTVTSGATISGGATVATGNLTVTSGGVTASNGTGTFKNLSVTSNGTFGGTVTAGGKITGSSGLEVTGNTKTTTLTVTSSATVGTDLTVSNAATVKTLHVTDDATIDDTTTTKNLVVTSNASIKNLNITSGGTITKDGDEYVTYIIKNNTNNVIDTTKGLKLYNNKIGVNVGPGLALMDDGSSSVKKLYVNFSEFLNSDNPEIRDAFNELLAALHLQRYVGENGVGVNFYVDGRTGSTLPAGITPADDLNHGTSASTPWKSLSYATQCLAKNYNISDKTVYIYVAAGTYNESVSLPLLQRTTGKVIICPIDSTSIVNVEYHDVSAGGSVFLHNGGLWELQHLNLKLVLEPQTKSAPQFPHIVVSTDSSGEVLLRNCNCSFVDNSVASDADHGVYTARLIAATGGHITLVNTGRYSEDTIASRTSTFSGTRVNAYVIWLYLEQLGHITYFRSGAGHAKSTISVTGSFSTFCSCNSNSQFNFNGTGDDPVFSYDIAAIGRGSSAYSARSGGTIVTHTANTTARDNYFPHGYKDIEGSTDPATNIIVTSEGSWVSPMENS